MMAKCRTCAGNGALWAQSFPAMGFESCPDCDTGEAIFRIRPNETTNQAIRRLGFDHVDHEEGDETCRTLRAGGHQQVSECRGRHLIRANDGALVSSLGCSPPVECCSEWICRGCPMD